jgi:rSAM/selenodomain-associated transferase 1
MNKALVIVFVKSPVLGTVKTRLAHKIGDLAALEIYKALITKTEAVTTSLDNDLWIYFSKQLTEDYWPDCQKRIQNGSDLGERMYNAFKDGFDRGYEKIVLIGSDLPDLNKTLLTDALEKLNEKNVVFGPADDGGYYLIGLNRLIPQIFIKKPWSQSNLLNVTLDELGQLPYTVDTLVSLNDIDTYEDLINSGFFKSDKALQEKLKQLHD